MFFLFLNIYFASALDEDLETPELKTPLITHEAVDSNKIIDWLISKQKADMDWGNDFDNSLAIIVLTGLNHNPTKIQITTNLLKKNIDEAGCWPKGQCLIKDTAFAMQALRRVDPSGTETKKAADWLKTNVLTDYSAGNWNLQLSELNQNDYNKNCYILLDSQKQKTIPIFPDGKDPWTNLQEYTTQNQLKLKADCSELKSTPIISTILDSGNNVYYLIKQETTKSYDIKLGSECLPEAYGYANCDVDSTAIALILLSQTKFLKDQSMLAWLTQQSQTPLSSAVLYSLTTDEKYNSQLLNLQDNAGTFGSMYSDAIIYGTYKDAYIINLNLTLDAINNQYDKSNYCWPKGNCNVQDTLLALYSGAITQKINPAYVESANEINGSKKSIQKDEEVNYECILDSECTKKFGKNYKCDKELYECVLSSSEDKTTKKDGYSTSEDDEDFDSPDEPDEPDIPFDNESNSWIIILTIIIVLLAASGAVYYSYKKGFLKIKKKSSDENPFGDYLRQPIERNDYAPLSRQSIQQPVQRRPVQKSAELKKLEEELEKSVKEAGKIAGRK